MTTTTHTRIHHHTTTTTIPNALVKRRKMSTTSKSLLPGLPDHISQLILSRAPPSSLVSVCRSWRRLIRSPSFPPYLSLYTLLLPMDTRSNSFRFSSYDPISSTWNSLPPPPPLRLLLRHPSFISRYMSVQSVTVSGKLVILSATSHQLQPAMDSPLIFTPQVCKWEFGPQIPTPRRWCVAGVTENSVVVASGIGSHYTTETARCVEKWNLQKNQWEKMTQLKDGKFCREPIEAVGWKSKLLMVNVKGNAIKEGVVYNVLDDTWCEMPEGMLAGWKGPAGALNEEKLYVVDESRGVLRKYDEDSDSWEDLINDERMKGAESLAAGGGRVCIVCCGGIKILVVDVAVSPLQFWVVEIPTGYQAVAVHILPRMNRPV